MMAYYKNWRKHNAEVLSLAADESDSSDADGLLRAQFSEDETASLSPSADGNIPYYDSDALVLSSDTDSEVAGNLSDDSAEDTPDLSEEVAAWAATNKYTRCEPTCAVLQWAGVWLGACFDYRGKLDDWLFQWPQIAFPYWGLVPQHRIVTSFVWDRTVL
ncbi:hypothetical protein G5714_004266 [Onychostoma macrolepis]|uniref:Uncharacterized protein n=1 Tax=Onychostoma macrolepis TaxID=369639 RepID=A0A7J6D488_9TELE|nr:hypothetical protein G5714_004266 [Onychostoma macrolepis]